MVAARRALLQSRPMSHGYQPRLSFFLGLRPQYFTYSRLSQNQALILLQRRLQSTAGGYTTIPPRRSLFSRLLRGFVRYGTVSLLGLFGGAYIGLTYLPNKDTLVALFRQPASASDAATLAAYTPPDALSAAINTQILQSPLAIQLRGDADFTESRPHMKIPEALRPTNLTGGTLAGPGRIPVPPLVFNETGGKSLVSVFYLGEQLCGHPGLVHGGMLATLLDEGLARCCFPALPNKLGVTASLKVDYRKPARAGRYYVLRASTQKVDGRKAWVKGWIEDMEEGTKVAEAEALFIEPRNASLMKRIYTPDK